MAFTEDLSVFLSTSDFAVSCSLGLVTINGILDNEYIEINEVSTLSPVLVVKTADVSTAVEGDAITVDDVSYKIITKESDGTGMTRCILQKQ